MSNKFHCTIAWLCGTKQVHGLLFGLVQVTLFCECDTLLLGASKSTTFVIVKLAFQVANQFPLSTPVLFPTQFIGHAWVEDFRPTRMLFLAKFDGRVG